MKHIKKRFLNQISVESFEGINKKNDNLIERFRAEDVDQSKLRSVKQGTEIIIFTDEHAIKAFAYKDKYTRDVYPVPEPDPVLIYFNFAQNSYTQLKKVRKELVNTLNPEKKLEKQ